VLSAKAEVADKVVVLEMGACDYVTKPFSPRELLARIPYDLLEYRSGWGNSRTGNSGAQQGEARNF